MVEYGTREFDEALDRYITGNYGEDQFEDEQEEQDQQEDIRKVCPDCKGKGHKMKKDESGWYKENCKTCDANGWVFKEEK